MTPDWYEDLAERLIEASEHAAAMAEGVSAETFRGAAQAALEMASSEQDELESVWQEAHGR